MNKEVEEKIKKLKEVAAADGLSVRFRHTTTMQGDFCIFIYDKSVRGYYIVGFDGNWDGKINFDYCLKQAYEWIEKRDNRYKKVKGKWIFKK